VTGIVIDADHFIDYYADRGFTLNIRDIYDACSAVTLKKLYLILHSYELAILLWAAVILIPLGSFWAAAAIGLTQHLIFDTITNRVVPFAYFFTYRLRKGFKKDLLIQEGEDRPEGERDCLTRKK
jgi:hypothetical protein